MKWNASIKFDTELDEFKFFLEGYPWENLTKIDHSHSNFFRKQSKTDFGKRKKYSEHELIHNNELIIVRTEHNETSLSTALICGKRREVRKGKKLKDRKQYPISMAIAEYGLKLNTDLNE